MNFIFEWSTRYLTSERSERVRYQVEHEKIKLISISGHVVLCLLYNILMTLLTIFRRFPKIYPNLSEGQTNVSEHSPNIFPRLTKISEDCRGLPKIAEEEPIMFRSYSKTSGYFLRDYVAKAMVIMISSRVKISCYLHFTCEDMKFSRESSLGISLVFI